MALETGSRIDPALNPVPAKVISSVRERPFGGILEFIARLDFNPAGVAIGAEGFLMAGGAGKFLLCTIKFMLEVKIGGPVIQGAPLIGMATGAVGQPFDFRGVLFGNTRSLGTGIENSPQDQHRYQE